MPIIAPVDAAVAARLFHGFADPTRLAILLALLDGEQRVVDLASTVERAQATVSEHLACLRGCGLVIVRVDGRASQYRLAGPEIVEFLRAAEVLLAATGEQVGLCTRTAGPS